MTNQGGAVMEKAIVVNDLHIPFQDRQAVKLFLKFVKFWKPERIFLNGDVMDFWEISRFTKPINIKSRLSDELSDTLEFLTELRQTAPKAKIDYLYANHEYRLEAYVMSNAPLASEFFKTLDEVLELEKLDIVHHNNHLKENYLKYGKLHIGHWDKYSKHSAYAAKALLEELGVSLIQGHTHKGGSHYKRDLAGYKVAYENFCLCQLDSTYRLHPNWHQGFSIVLMDTKTGYFHVEQLPIVDGKIYFGEKIIS